MVIYSVLAWLVIGALAGGLAGTFVKGGGLGLVGDIIVGLIGAVTVGWLADALHITIGAGWISAIIAATLGACLLLVALRAARHLFDAITMPAFGES